MNRSRRSWRSLHQYQTRRRGYRSRSSYKVNRDTLLLTVEDHFLIEGRGLIVVPHRDLRLRRDALCLLTTMFRIRRPDGTEQFTSTRFLVEHLPLRGGGSKWNIVVMFPQGTKETIPIGSRIYVCSDTMMKLDGDGPSDTENATNVS